MTMTEAPNFSTVLVPKSEKVVPGRTIVGIHLRDGGVRTLRLIKRVPNDFQNVDNVGGDQVQHQEGMGRHLGRSAPRSGERRLTRTHCV